ncbi:MAG: lamin tail domain-containing protein [Candidatus Nealsonbacteria bacterium]|nr:lamin tail domain-containing protein [Candidatus Nealsonbacteria bacterium]
MIDVGGDYNSSDNWRAGSEYGGSPGYAGAGPVRDVVINEVLTHAGSAGFDTIELLNTTGEPIDVGGWYLSDSNDNYRKFRIPDDTVIPGGQYVTFNETDFNPNPQNPGPNHFELDERHGGDVWLLQTDPGGQLSRFADRVKFSAAVAGESFGRWPDGTASFADGTGDLYPMTTPTLDPGNYENAAPRVGPVIISEVMYHPPEVPMLIDPDELEFIELYNPTLEPIDLTHWRLGGDVDFALADGTTLGPQQTLTVINFDPIDAEKLRLFRIYYDIDDSVDVVGPFGSRLSNSSDVIQLFRAGEESIDEPGFFPLLVEDELRYDDDVPWPTDADGGGDSLNRSGPEAWSQDPTQWFAETPSPGWVRYGPSPSAGIVGRYLLYGESAFDGADAIAADKRALLPGETATYTNYSNYSQGINGVVVDVVGLSDLVTPDADAFTFRVGNDNDPDGWQLAPEPDAVLVDRFGGIGNSARVTFVWQDGEIRNQWLQVTARATALGMLDNDVFYFGNAVAEAGDSSADARVTVADLLLARNNPRDFLHPAGANFPYDFNRDGYVNATDVLLARNNRTSFLDVLNLIDLPGGAEEAQQPAVADLAWLSEFDQTATDQRSAEKEAAAAAVDKLLGTYWP